MSVVVNDIPPRVQLTAGANQTVFPFAFLAYAQTDITVYYRPQGVPANDLTQILTYGVNYTVTLTPQPGVGGTVTLLNSATAGDFVTIVRAQADQRLNFYTDGGPFTATNLNSDFNQDILMIQQNKMYDIQVAPHYNLCDTITTPADIYLPTLPPGTSWRKNGAGTAIEAYSPTVGGVALPTVIGDIAAFSDTNGSFTDSGISIHNVPIVIGGLLTAAQVRAMFAFPIQIANIANYAPSTILYIMNATFFYTFGGAAFAGGGNIGIWYDNTRTTTAGITLAPAGFTDQVVSRTAFIQRATATVNTAPTLNRSLYLSNATAPFTLGNGAFLTYRITIGQTT